MPMQTTSQWGSLLPKGLGTDQEAQQATAAMRQSPWYQQQLKQWGVTPQGDAYGNVKLNDDQQQQLYDLALKNGIGLNNKYDQVDENGQISEAHHKLRNGLIAAAIAGLGATGLGAAGIGPLSGLFGAGAGAAGAAAGSVGAGTGFGAAGAGLAGTGAGIGATASGAGSVLGGLVGGGGVAGTTMSNLMSPQGSNIKPLDFTGGGNGPGSSISDLLAANNPQMIPNGLATSLTPAELAGVGGSGASGAGGIMKKLLSAAGQKGFADLSSGLGSLTQGIANNRALQGSFAQNYDRNAIDAQNSANTTRQSALKQLAQSSYLLNRPTPPTGDTSIQLNGQMRKIPTFGTAPLPTSDAERTGATNLQTTANKLLAPGGTVTPQPLSDYATPGTGEQIGNAGSVISGLLPTVGSIYKMFQ